MVASIDATGDLIAESNVYDPHILAPLEDGGIGFDAEWCDDFLHSVFAVVRPGEQVSIALTSATRIWIKRSDWDTSTRARFAANVDVRFLSRESTHKDWSMRSSIMTSSEIIRLASGCIR